MTKPTDAGALRRATRLLRLRLKLLRAVWKDPRTPWYARAVAALTVAYAISPIDLIPDFLPVIGYLDDLLIVPAGFWLAARLVPRQVWDEHRRRIESEEQGDKLDEP